MWSIPQKFSWLVAEIYLLHSHWLVFVYNEIANIFSLITVADAHIFSSFGMESQLPSIGPYLAHQCFLLISYYSAGYGVRCIDFH
jgi:hypothetical protein